MTITSHSFTISNTPSKFIAITLNTLLKIYSSLRKGRRFFQNRLRKYINFFTFFRVCIYIYIFIYTCVNVTNVRCFQYDRFDLFDNNIYFVEIGRLERALTLTISDFCATVSPGGRCNFSWRHPVLRHIALSILLNRMWDFSSQLSMSIFPDDFVFSHF